MFKAGGVAALQAFKNTLQDLDLETREHIMDNWGSSGEEAAEYLYMRISRLLDGCSERTANIKDI